MIIKNRNQTLVLSGIVEFGDHELVRAALSDEFGLVVIDLSELRFKDSAGVAAFSHAIITACALDPALVVVGAGREFKKVIMAFDAHNAVRFSHYETRRD